jgi:hypothetical protein
MDAKRSHRMNASGVSFTSFNLSPGLCGACLLGYPITYEIVTRRHDIPGVTRTPNLRFRKPLLYPVELRGQDCHFSMIERYIPSMAPRHAHG